VELEEVPALTDIFEELYKPRTSAATYQWSIPPCLGPFLMAMRFAWT